MLRLIAAVQKVELVGEKSWLEHNSVALAAIGAALLAALVAVLNRRAELQHDREMRNRDHIREIVDLSYVEVGQAIKEISELLGVVRGTETWRNQAGPEADDDALIEALDRELGERKADTHAAIMNLTTATGRLEMRLGRSHPIAVAHLEVRRAIQDLDNRAPSSLRENRPGNAREADDRVNAKVATAHTEFREACFAWSNE
jgi:hypothetical protein